MKVLILGATGFIGSAVLQKLAADGHVVTGLGRDVRKAAIKWPSADWVGANMAGFSSKDWQELLSDHGAVVNCAGALQDGLSDDLAATQEKSMLALYAAAKALDGRLIVQISARTTGHAAERPFLATKRQADEALAASGLPFVILRPALVIGRNAHGGSALLRALASFPRILPLVHADSLVETVSIDDVANAVSAAIDGAIGTGGDFDLAAQRQWTLADLVRLHRTWLGLPDAPMLALPAWLGKAVALGADFAGALGWRSPLRSTAMAVMSDGVLSNRQNPASLQPADAAATLAAHPSGVQDLWFARLYLLKPIVILALSLFWLLSGLIALIDPTVAAAHFRPLIPAAGAIALTVATSLVDIGLGLAILLRPLAGKALLGMLIVSLTYLVGASFVEPQLWTDPLGPLVKVLPSLALTVAGLAILDER